MKPEILLCPNIPKPLHGIAPRVVLGQAWWERERHICYEKAGQKCECCDTPRANAWPKPWLEAHEWYTFDYRNGLITFRKLVCLCPACHMFIHSGRLEILIQTKKIPINEYMAIKDHGNAIIDKADIRYLYQHRHDSDVSTPWKNWRMVINGKEYGPSTGSFIAWQRGDWKNWRP